MYSDKYDWETRDDANTLRRYQELKSNPDRMRKAKECIADSVSVGEAVLKDKPINQPLRKRNPATVGKLPIPH